ncbi:MAG: hypothetical protein U9R19_11805 [Bacteroidota bacterium]|nr:hypothetical protein [Bacteroidota bacterium]
MILRKISLLIALLFSVCFVYAQGTVIDVDIINDVAGTYSINIILHQPSAQPSTGSLTFTAASSTTTQMHLEFDDADICIDEIKATYNGSCLECPISAELDVDCDVLTGDKERIAPLTDEQKCYVFEYTVFNDVYNNCEELFYEFKIHQ